MSHFPQQRALNLAIFLYGWFHRSLQAVCLLLEGLLAAVKDKTAEVKMWDVMTWPTYFRRLDEEKICQFERDFLPQRAAAPWKFAVRR